MPSPQNGAAAKRGSDDEKAIMVELNWAALTLLTFEAADAAEGAEATLGVEKKKKKEEEEDEREEEEEDEREEDEREEDEREEEEEEEEREDEREEEEEDEREDEVRGNDAIDTWDTVEAAFEEAFDT